MAMPQNSFASCETVSLEVRRSDRLNMYWSGELVLRSGRYDCRVIDISHHGAKLTSAARVRPGDDGLFHCEGLDLLFRVERHEPNFLAISFIDELDQDIGEDDVETVSRIARNQQAFRYLLGGLVPPLRRRGED
ncbi:PilZ domain-containing protein [Altererythrobacter xiamenensis]|uniref:PilZ domain-containing protein n=1 Tax=Altererythrobacter xiamenensis TaxID=1316679 RepID=A0A1Y6FG57_9SPHN|nr:PilZ domain-containing protein [Altererythrobacter xiamenensis]SMQ73737.1 PilZ domain-containing protein [Altererythrobacter xiamenensis]